MAEKKKIDKKVKKIERLNMGINEFGELTSSTIMWRIKNLTRKKLRIKRIEK
jgi:hypothetical protein